jgi:phosphomannomutase
MALIKSISGIRGTIGGKENAGLTPIDVVKYAAAFCEEILAGNNKKIVIGRDGRLSGEMVNHLIVGALISKGAEVIDIGLSTTPTVEMAVKNENAAGGIILTASHNPKQWNALKLLDSSGEFISAEIGQNIINRVNDNNLVFNPIDKLGSHHFKAGYIDWHIEQILKLEILDINAIKSKGFKFVVDTINSTGAIAVPKLLEALGVEYLLINNEITGDFAHNPEPLPENLVELSSAVKFNNAHGGISVDPDVDRLAFICDDGEPFGEEYTLVAVADYILKRKVGNTVSNLSSTRALRDITTQRGGQYFASAVGEVNVVKEMKKVNAVIGGEGNGGVIFPDLHYGRDALVGIALFLSHLANENKALSTLKSTYPNYIMIKDRLELEPGTDLNKIFDRIKIKYKNYPINTVDGVKIDFEDEWVHLRASNTEPIIRVYAEGLSMNVVKNVTNTLKKDIIDALKEQS